MNKWSVTFKVENGGEWCYNTKTLIGAIAYIATLPFKKDKFVKLSKIVK